MKRIIKQDIDSFFDGKCGEQSCWFGFEGEGEGCRRCLAAYLKEKGYCRQSEWVSVNDDTPKDSSERVQVFLRDTEFTKPIGENKIDTDRYVDGKWVRWGKYVTHWKPLPDPPIDKE